jgi:hypothetical protein
MDCAEHEELSAMRKMYCLGGTVIVVSLATPAIALRGGGWTTVGADAHRTAAVRTDPKIYLGTYDGECGVRSLFSQLVRTG